MIDLSLARADLVPIWFRCVIWPPTSRIAIVHAVDGAGEVITGSGGEDPWCAAYRAIGFVLERFVPPAVNPPAVLPRRRVVIVIKRSRP